MLNLPSPHGYGVSTILNEWKAKQRRDDEMGLRKGQMDLANKKFDLEQQKFQAQLDERKELRKAKATSEGFRFLELGFKNMDKDGMFETGYAMAQQGVNTLNKVYPGLGIDLSGAVDAKSAREEIEKQVGSKLNNAWKRVVEGDPTAKQDLKIFIPKAQNLGLIDKNTADFYKSELESEKPQPYTLSPGAKRFSGDNQMVAENPASNRPSVEVNIGEKRDSIEEKANERYGTLLGDAVGEVFKGATEAVNQNAQLDQVALAIAQGADTGYGEEMLLNLKSFGQTIGLDVGDLSGQELVRKISNEMALRLRNPDSGLGLTGNTSNKDLDFLKASVIGLARTEDGNIAIINAMKKFNKMRSDLAQEQSRIIKENNGYIPADLNQRLIDYANEYSLLTDIEKTQIEGLLKGSRVPSGAIEFLRANPQYKDQFKAKYGFVPEGM